MHQKSGAGNPIFYMYDSFESFYLKYATGGFACIMESICNDLTYAALVANCNQAAPNKCTIFQANIQHCHRLKNPHLAQPNASYQYQPRNAKTFWKMVSYRQEGQLRIVRVEKLHDCKKCASGVLHKRQMSDLLLKVAELNKKHNETSADTPAGYQLRMTLKASIVESEKVI